MSEANIFTAEIAVQQLQCSYPFRITSCQFLCFLSGFDVNFSILLQIFSVSLSSFSVNLKNHICPKNCSMSNTLTHTHTHTHHLSLFLTHTRVVNFNQKLGAAPQTLVKINQKRRKMLK